MHAVGVETHATSIAGAPRRCIHGGLDAGWGRNRQGATPAGGGSIGGVTRRIGSAVAAVVLAAGVVVLAACGADVPATPSDPVLAQGQQIYGARCASCHGAAGGGGIAPALAGRMTERFPDIDDNIALVAGGVPGTSMRAFADILSPEEIEAVVLYTRETLTGS